MSRVEDFQNRLEQGGVLRMTGVRRREWWRDFLLAGLMAWWGILAVPSLVPSLSAEEGIGSADTASSPLERITKKISTQERRELLEKRRILRFHNTPEGIVPKLVPDIQLAQGMIQGIQAAGLTIGVEGLFYYDADELPSAYLTAKRDTRNLVLYNILRSVSTLEGLEYYSATRGKMRVLFQESWVLRDLSSMERVPDPLVDEIPVNARMNIFQKDKSFGRNTHAMTLQAMDEMFLMNLVNITPMLYWGLIRVVDPRKMQINMVIVPIEEEGLLVYGSMMAQTRDVQAFMDRAKNSFANRVIALGEWYGERLKEEFSL